MMRIMPSDPFTFTPPKVLGAPECRWRAVRRDDGSLRIERRVVPYRQWEEQTTEELAGEVANGTDAGRWLRRLKEAGLLS